MTHAFSSECDALAVVAASARAQLAALRDGSVEGFEAAAAETFDAVAELDRRRQARERRAATMPPASRDDRAALEAAAAEARAACDALELALEHAVELGRDLIGAWRQLSAPAASQTYTAQGAVAAGGTPHLHRTG